MSNVQSMKVVLQLSMYIHVVGVRFYHITVHILLILKPTVFITSMLNCLVAVPVQGYVPAHTT